ncbi:hypothetical protein QM012_000176 [Aureobasidium pullulans]|uniref:Xylanolytic transcriptional activator regulatory domain-containing protein n=1 Tax=Aureobasidium pullulans TaxID=5580 RepID=A0ABR0TV33_AURPU
MSLREEIESLRKALKEANAQTINDRVSDNDFAINRISHLDPRPEGGRTPLSEDCPLESRSSQAMNELSSLMLQLDVADIGEPSFTLSSNKVREEIFPNAVQTCQETAPYNGVVISTADQKHLVKCFIDNFNRFHQFLDSQEAESMILYIPGTKDSDLSFRNSALLAVAASCCENTRLRDLEEHFFTQAESLVLRSIRTKPSDLVVQGLALLAWIELKRGNDSMAYNWIAMATGQVLHLGLHASALKSTLMTHDQNQMVQNRRVRSFWAYFSVDRLVTSSLGMNCTMHWQRVKSPSFTSIITCTPSVDEWAHERFCEMWHLWDSCMDQGYAFGWYKLSQAEKEKLVLHSHQALVKFNKGNNPCLHIQREHMSETAIWLQLAYNAALILIHRPLLSEASNTKLGRFSLTVATTAASTISRILREFGTAQEIMALAPQVVDYISIAAIIHLLNATSGRNRLGRQSANGLRTCVIALSSMSSMWKTRSQNSLQHIQNLAHRWEVVWALPLQYTQVLPPENNPSISDTLEETEKASNVYKIFDDIALDAAVQGLWDAGGAADQDWILENAQRAEGNVIDFWDLNWQLHGE